MKKTILILLLLIAGLAATAQTIPTYTKPNESKPKAASPAPSKPKKETKVVYVEKESNKATIKFLSDTDAVLFIDGEKRGNLKKDIPLRINLPKGQFILKAVGLDNENDFVKWNYEILETGVEKLEEISLQPIIVKRLNMVEAEKEKQRTAIEAETKLKKQREKALLVVKDIEMIKVGNFSIGKYEVTQTQWQAVMGTNPSENLGCGNCPVENVTWNEVQQFIQELNTITDKNYRLPSVAEWEFAAKGGEKTQNYDYSGSNDINTVAWYELNSDGNTHPVGQKQPNELGIYDMSGNVWEWCTDLYKSNPTWRIRRGGCYFNIAAWSKVDFDHFYEEESRTSVLGIRLVSP